jgi:hypothetical protein
MIQDLWPRWIVTALFVIGAAECGFAIAADRRSWTHVVGHSLHFVMAVAMAVMAWPRGAALPTTGPMVFFLAATVWFVVVALAESGHRASNAYHASMMLAMAWMYAVMSGGLLPTPTEGTGGSTDHMASTASMPGMDMPATAISADTVQNPPFISGLNWLCTAGFAIAAVWWVYLYVARRRAEPASANRFFGIACQAMMAAGMAIMFGVML